jgi:predicted porin
MRKILLGTTAVVGLALAAPAAFAQGIAPGSGGQGQTLTPAPAPSIAGAGGLTVRLGGYFEFSGANIQDDNDRALRVNNSATATPPGAGAATHGQARRKNDFRNDMELAVFVDGRAANGMQYGAVLEMQMDNQANTTVDFDEMYGFLKGSWGEFRFGQEDSAASLLIVRAPAAGALGGDAVWDEFVSNAGLHAGSPYVTSGINDGNDATKVVYLSPQFFGFDFGVSYAANAGEGERVDTQRDRVGTTANPGGVVDNEISVALRYRGTIGAVGLQAGAGAMWADGPARTPTAEFESISAYFFGAQIAAYGFAIGGEYAFGKYNGASVGRTAIRKGLDDSNHWLAGATYTLGSVVLGAVYGNGTQDNGGTAAANLKERDHTVWGIGVLYNLAPGLGLYAAYNSIQDENVPIAAPNATSTANNIATFNGSNTRNIDVLMAGIRLAF